MPEYIYTIARLATRGRDLMEKAWWREAGDPLSEEVEKAEEIFKEILMHIEEAKEKELA